jgi:purine-binding chemotaxis protein CheW
MSIKQERPEDVAAAPEPDTNGYVTFALGGEWLALPMERVQEIIRMPDVVEVPLAPHVLEGLANLRSRVLPIVSLRACCGQERVAADEATRVIVVDCGTPLGFVVDRVAAVVAVQPEDIESTEAIESTLDTRLLDGVIKAHDGTMIAILDIQQIVDREFAATARRLAERKAAPTVAAISVADTENEADDEVFEMVSFVVDGQEYALPIDEIQEIVRVPDAVSTVPNADRRVLGVMDLRGGLLPLISLRRVFGLQQEQVDESSRVVVVSLEDVESKRRVPVGIVMDTVREVLRVPRELVDALPNFVGGSAATEVESVCRLDGGGRLVSVLSAQRLFAGVGLQAAVEAYDGDEEAKVMGDDQQGEWTDTDEQLVVFRIATEEYCLSVDAVQEIIRVPEALIRVPKALPFVEGMVNLRGTVLPVIDLRAKLGLARSERDDLQRIVVVIADGVRTGFVVDAVVEVLKLEQGSLEQAPELSDEQAALISKVANLIDDKRILLVLDHSELLGAGGIAAPEQDGIVADEHEAAAA